MSLTQTLRGACVMAPMTKGSNLPYRQLCIELGARVTMSEMTVARKLKQRRRGEFALIRRAPQEPFFGVQLAGNDPDEMAWAAALVEARGADSWIVNLGCPIDHFTRKGLGAALGRQPARIRRIVAAMKAASSARRSRSRSGSDGTTRRGTTWRSQRQRSTAAPMRSSSTAAPVRRVTRMAADWDAIGEVAAAVQVPVVGNGDLLFRHEIRAALAQVGLRRGDDCARGADQAVDLPRSCVWRREPDGGRAARDLSPVCRARQSALGRGRLRDDAHSRVPRVASRVLVSVCTPARGRELPVNAIARIAHAGDAARCAPLAHRFLPPTAISRTPCWRGTWSTPKARHLRRRTSP